jgi:hypothetical protein
MNETRVCPAYVGFYHIPIVWCCEPPSEQFGNRDNVLDIVIEGKLQIGIRYRVRRDGYFWFDCNMWERGAYTVIPGYERIPGGKVPREVVEAENLAEKRAYNRSMLINAYQLCLNAAHVKIRRRSTQLGLPVQAIHLIHSSDFDNPKTLLYRQVPEPYCLFVNQALLNLFSREGRESRRLIENDVLEYSFELFNKVTEFNSVDALKIIEILFYAFNYYREGSFSNSLTTSWIACETLINFLWDNYLRNNKSNLPDDIKRINRPRFEKLAGRDFTASVVIEVLELLNIISINVYKDLDEVRKKRNKWLHSLGEVSDYDSVKAYRAATNLFELATGIPLNVGLSRMVPGKGRFPLEMYEMPA